jgi:HlyD family secretion protein
MDRRIKKKRWTLRRVLWGSLGGLFAAAVLYELVFGDHSSRLNVQAERITISTVEVGPFQEFIPLRGTVLPILTIYLDALEGGRVEEVFIEEGTMVLKGDPILKLSNPDLEVRVMSQEAVLFERVNDMENTRIQLETQAIGRQERLITLEYDIQRAKREHDRNAELWGRKLIARSRYEESKDNHEHLLRQHSFTLEKVRQDSMYRAGQLAQLEASVKKLRMNVEAVKRNLENLVIRAPVSGQLTSVNAEIGELKSRGQRLGQVDVLEGYKVRVEIDEFYIQRIGTGLTGTLDLAGKPYKLVIKKVYPDVEDGEFEVDMEFLGDTPMGIRRGQTLPIRLALGDLSEALLLARGGFYQVTGGNWVFLVDASGGLATRRPVRIGRQNPEFFEVLEGLEPGDRVVTSSYDNYEEIDRLVIK